MRLTQYFIPTLKEIPADAVIPSHQLMLRAGMIRLLGAGIYSFLPLGYRVLKKVETIIREEMDAIGGMEFHLPALNPKDVWEETGRVEAFGDTMFHLKNRELVLAPTHEEIITSIARSFVRSYRDMPQIWYQIQTKFRNEPRPKSGVIRSRQFTMKDAYSLDNSPEGLDASYDKHVEAYKRIYSRCGLKFFIVGASSGAMGGSGSQEFMVESDAGEDLCAFNMETGYAANIEIASSKIEPVGRLDENPDAEKFATPDARTIDDLIEQFSIPDERCAKSLVYFADGEPYLIFMAGNDQLNEEKLKTALGAIEVRPAHDEELAGITGADSGSIGPINLKSKIKQIADVRIQNANGMVSGANENGFHYKNIDLDRDADISAYHDLRTVLEGEPDPVGGKPLSVKKAIEVGHVFKLGTKYSDSMKALFLDDKGEEHPIIMGSYGIGVERIVACHIEQRHDKDGIMWHPSIAPFQIQITALKYESDVTREHADRFYNELTEAGLEVLFDDREGVSPGFKFKDADLLGMPVNVIVGEKHLKDGNVEIKIRETGERKITPIDDVAAVCKQLVDELGKVEL
ncbi:MAG: proline--tRNA ligase [Ectothiorhodospiraceae bacterium]|nr:proline--tRNA ligase [Ectothiorhodospiraceae bacterium]